MDELFICVMLPFANLSRMLNMFVGYASVALAEAFNTALGVDIISVGAGEYFYIG